MNKKQAECEFLYLGGGEPLGRKLTPQESRCNRLLANGATNETIATILNVTVQQVHNLKSAAKVKGYEPGKR